MNKYTVEERFDRGRASLLTGIAGVRRVVMATMLSMLSMLLLAGQPVGQDDGEGKTGPVVNLVVEVSGTARRAIVMQGEPFNVHVYLVNLTAQREMALYQESVMEGRRQRDARGEQGEFIEPFSLPAESVTRVPDGPDGWGGYSAIELVRWVEPAHGDGASVPEVVLGVDTFKPLVERGMSRLRGERALGTMPERFTASVGPIASTELPIGTYFVRVSYDSTTASGEGVVRMAAVAESEAFEVRAAASSSELVDVFFGAANYYAGREEWQLALGSIDEVLAVSPEYRGHRALVIAGNALERLGHLEEALKHYNAYVAAVPDNGRGPTHILLARRIAKLERAIGLEIEGDDK